MKILALEEDGMAAYVLRKCNVDYESETYKAIGEVYINSAVLDTHYELNHRPYLVLSGKVNRVAGHLGGKGIDEFYFEDGTVHPVTYNYEFSEPQLAELIREGYFEKEFEVPNVLSDMVVEMPLEVRVTRVNAKDETKTPLVFVSIKNAVMDTDMDACNYDFAAEFKSKDRNRDKDFIKTFNTPQRGFGLNHTVEQATVAEPAVQSVAEEVFAERPIEKTVEPDKQTVTEVSETKETATVPHEVTAEVAHDSMPEHTVKPVPLGTVSPDELKEKVTLETEAVLSPEEKRIITNVDLPAPDFGELAKVADEIASSKEKLERMKERQREEDRRRRAKAQYVKTEAKKPDGLGPGYC